MARRRRNPHEDRRERTREEALRFLHRHPLFQPLAAHVYIRRSSRLGGWDAAAWAIAYRSRSLALHPQRHGSTEEWIWVLAHGLLHSIFKFSIAFEHFVEMPHPRAWSAACDVVAARFLHDLRLGTAPGGMRLPDVLPARDERSLYEHFVTNGVPDWAMAAGTAGARSDLELDAEPPWAGAQPAWNALFAHGLRQAVQRAVDVAGGLLQDLTDRSPSRSAAQRAREWFTSSYPLLGALARSFEIVETTEACHALDIAVAAVDEVAQVIYVNPGIGLDLDAARFVIAHECLHVGLRHLERRRGRDPYLWNVACDFVINGWLLEMQIGAPPPLGMLHDPALAGLSAEEVYDRIAKDLRRMRRLATLRGTGRGDMLEGDPLRRSAGEPRDLDAFYRECLARGLELHCEQGRGLLPAGLVQEIRALAQPAIPWDVELAQWFDAWFPALERRRSYARPSRRQAATPEIPRPRWVLPDELAQARTFGVVLDTSGSMDSRLLAKGLGAIASYAVAHEVGAVRVVFCDAAAYDAGYLEPEAIAGRVRVRGRGGTVLQPGIDLLQRADDFPPAGPLLVITDGECDVVRIAREHAFLIPRGRRLPFRPRGPVFEIE